MIELGVDRSKTEGFYETLKVARIPEPSIFGGPSSSRRCIVPPSATVFDPTAQAQGEDATVGFPPLPGQQPKTANVPTEMAPICANIGDAQQVYYCQVEGCHEEPSTFQVTICTCVHQASEPYPLRVSKLIFCFVLSYKIVHTQTDLTFLFINKIMGMSRHPHDH